MLKRQLPPIKDRIETMNLNNRSTSSKAINYRQRSSHSASFSRNLLPEDSLKEDTFRSDVSLVP